VINWTLSLALWAACFHAVGCTGEISASEAPSVVAEDAGPVQCKLVRIKCEWSDPTARTGWHCFYEELCDEEDAGT